MAVQYITEWVASPHYPYTPMLGNSVETNSKLLGMLDPFKVDVPGSLYKALERDGIIPSVFTDMNSLSAEWVKDRWWLYEAKFDAQNNTDSRLVFGCVDYKCHVYLNNEYLGIHEGAVEAFDFNVSQNLREKDNILRVLIENIP